MTTTSTTLKKNAPAAEPPAAAKKTADHGLTELRVWSVPPVNRQLLICHKPEDDGSDPTKLVGVIVRDNALFLKGMKLKARAVAANRYSLEGSLPRWRGRW